MCTDYKTGRKMHMTGFLTREASGSYIYILDSVHNRGIHAFHRTNDITAPLL